jgi:hypothetical protein
MSFGNKSAVKNHLSTKHPLLSRTTAENKEHEKIIEPLHIESRFAERAPPVEVEEPEEIHSHQ